MDRAPAQILIISFRADPHVPLVTTHLDKRGIRWGLLCADELGTGSSAHLALDGGQGSARLTGPGLDLDPSTVTAVWNRRWLRPTVAGLGDDPIAQHYAREQWWHAGEAVLRSIGGLWVNAPAALDRARSKGGQLAAAAQVGLAVPSTLVSADLDEVRRFADHVGRPLVTKLVSPGTPLREDPAEQYMVFTERVDVDDLDADAVAAAPAIYQPELIKAYEVRATIVGDEILACRIDSTASERTALDWRHYDFDNVAHDPIELPAEITDGLLELSERFGLRYGAADLVVGPDGTWTFLELNPNGQWAWIEERTGLPIGSRLADLLAGG